MIEKRLTEFRKKIRANHKSVIDTIINDESALICIFCASTKNLSDEHLFPKWIFENNQDNTIETSVNGQIQNLTTTKLLACEHCNSYLLGFLERYLEQLFRNHNDRLVELTEEDQMKIILWLELIDYKFVSFNLRRKFIKPKNGKYDPLISDIPILMMQWLDLSEAKIFSRFRRSLKRLAVKNKSDQLNSLVFLKSSNKDFHFFHHTNEFIFLEFPQYQMGLFYHYNRIFDDNDDAVRSANELIKKHY